MKVGNKQYRTIWVKQDDPTVIQIIDQRKLPFEFVVEDLVNYKDALVAIKDMHVRGAGLIGATAAYGMYLAALEAEISGDFDSFLKKAAEELVETRPTAVNLAWAVDRQMKAINGEEDVVDKVDVALTTAHEVADEDAENSLKIGKYGLEIIKKIYHNNGGLTVNVLTHCNAGWLAFIDHGTATAPIYAAHDSGIPVHVWVDETRPRNQGARLTAWELKEHGVPHTIIPDNAGGHLMQHRMVDMAIVGTDRTTRNGDVANKIGTYLKALAAKDNSVPFYVALPSSSIDWNVRDGINEIAIEQRGAEEVKYMDGLLDGKEHSFLITPPESPVANYGFDVTPAHLISGLITERGICEASEEGLLKLFPEFK
jgi:methylthioribose-1-phosphate isomerase